MARASGAGFTPPVLVGGGGSDFDDEAQPAFANVGAGEAAGLAVAFDGGDDGPPLDVLEAQMRSELAARGASSSPASPRASARRAAAADDDDDDATQGGGGKGAPLPELDALVARLPNEVRDTLDELFRARFVSVKKLPKKVFQASSAKAPPAET